MKIKLKTYNKINFKKFMSKRITILTIGFSLLIFGLKARHTHSEMKMDHHKGTSYQAPTNFQSQLAGVFTSNLSLNDAFISSEASNVKTQLLL